MSWTEQQFNDALAFTDGDKILSHEVIELAEFVREIGFIEYPQITMPFDE